MIIFRKLVHYAQLLVLIFVLIGCSSEEIIHIYSPDKRQTLTVITRDNIQYLIDGEHYNVPDTNYVKLDISKIDLAGALYVCWRPSKKKKWDVVINKAIITESKLDTSKYIFFTEIPLNEKGIPTAAKYTGPNCGQVALDLGKIISKTETTIKVIK